MPKLTAEFDEGPDARPFQGWGNTPLWDRYDQVNIMVRNWTRDSGVVPALDLLREHALLTHELLTRGVRLGERR